MTVYERLLAVQDTKYREFQSKLVPNISKDAMIGVRTPEMRKVAKDVFGGGKNLSVEAESFLHELPHKFYEENMIHLFLISMIKDFDGCIEQLERFLPFIDCWPVCDQSNPKVFKKNHERLLPFVKKWIASEHTYTSRFGMRILMNEFLDDDFKPEYLEWIASKHSDDYYLKMMIAWFFATAVVKQYDASIPFIENHRLDYWTHNKAIQKALESFRVSDEHKEYLRRLKYTHSDTAFK